MDMVARFQLFFCIIKKATKYPHKDHIILEVKTNILYQMVSTLQAANNVAILEELFEAFEYVLLQYFDS